MERHYVLFDTDEINDSSTEVDFFTRCQGQGFKITTTTSKTNKHTNLRQPNQLPSGWVFTCHAIGLAMGYEAIRTDDPLDTWESAFCESILEVKIEDKIWLEAPAKVFTPGFGPNWMSPAATIAIPYMQSGAPSPEARYSLGNHPIVLQGGNFEYNLLVTNSSTAALTVAQQVQIILTGILSSN